MTWISGTCRDEEARPGLFLIADEADAAAFWAGLEEFIGAEEPDDQGETR